jgi:hypothetical protein
MRSSECQSVAVYSEIMHRPRDRIGASAFLVPTVPRSKA